MRPIGKITSEGRAHAALYARVSTHAGQNPEMQLAELRGYCQRRGWEIAGEYVDVGISGAKEKRPQLDAMLAACRKRQVDAVVVYRYDRFARSLRQPVNALCEFDSPRCLYAIGAGQMNVEEHHIGFELARKPDDLLCVRRLTNHAQIKFHLQDLAKEGAKGTAILCDQDPNRGHLPV